SDLDKETIQYIESTTMSFLKEREAYLVEELEYLNEALGESSVEISLGNTTLESKVEHHEVSVPMSIPEREIPPEKKANPRKKFPEPTGTLNIDPVSMKEAMMGGNNQSPISSSDKGDSRFYLPSSNNIDGANAKRFLHAVIGDERIERIVYDFIGKRKDLTGERETLFKDHLERFKELYNDYDSLKFSEIQDKLGESPSDVIRILSSYPGNEVVDFVRMINPYNRGQKHFFAIRKNVSEEEILTPLFKIQEALNEGHFSYYDVSQVLGFERKMESNHPLFEPVAEVVFTRREDGTYDEGSIEKFREETKGYRFKMLKRIFNSHQPSIDSLVDSLGYYEGPLTKRIDIIDAPSRRPQDPTEIYMFKCDEDWAIDVKALVEEFGLPYHA
ncbi:MAG: hypothetical protein KKB29_03075, partial [Nanoarchaeota archaeon]|nr:hypothetical protein [Nanoarchaeota archaeon]